MPSRTQGLTVALASLFYFIFECMQTPNIFIIYITHIYVCVYIYIIGNSNSNRLYLQM